MFFAIVIQIGASIYSYDNLSYSNIETCEYHKAKIESLLMYKWKPTSVTLAVVPLTTR